MQNYYWEDLNYTWQANQDKNTKPLNLMFNDILDEDFIEKNLLVSQEENKKIEELDEITNSSNTNSKTDSENNSKNNIKNIENIIENNKPNKISYGFGRTK